MFSCFFSHLLENVFLNVPEKRKNHISILNSLILVPDSVPGQMIHATVKDLNPWVDYEFRVVAINGVGVGEPGTPSKHIQTQAAGILSVCCLSS